MSPSDVCSLEVQSTSKGSLPVVSYNLMHSHIIGMVTLEQTGNKYLTTKGYYFAHLKLWVRP